MSNNKDFIIKNALEVGKDTKTTLGTITSSDVDLSTGNYFADTLAANTTYTFSNAGDVQAFQVEVTGGAIGYDISSAVYDSVSFSVSSQDLVPTGIRFNNDGTKLYLVGRGTDSVYQYSLSVAYDLTTISYDSVSLFVGSQDILPTDLAFSVDGTKLYVVGYDTDNVYQYPLSTAFDLSTADRFSAVSFSVASQASIPYGVTFNNTGTKMYILGSSVIYQYTLSTAWDVTTSSYDSISFSFSGEDAAYAIAFNADGTKLFTTGNTSDSVYRYSLSTPFDVSTLSYDSVSFSVTSQDTFPLSIIFNASGDKMYVLGSTNDTIYQYSGMSSDATLTWPSSVEWTAGVAPSAPGAGETDVYTFVTDDGGTSYVGLQTADNLS